MKIASTAIETRSGRAFDYDNMRLEDIKIEDVASSLSKICRYNGHGNAFYSVAEHCLLLAEYVMNTSGDEVIALHMLLHELGEPYIGDHVSPVKNLCPAIRDLEHPILEMACFKFGLQYPFPPIVKELDIRIQIDEKLKLFPDSRYTWYAEQLGFEPLGVNIRCIQPGPALEYEFLDAFESLTGFEVKRNGT